MTIPPLFADTDLDLEPDADGELGAPVRSSIQSIEVGFRLLEVFMHATGPMILRGLTHVAPTNPIKAHRYLVNFARLELVTQTPEGRYDLGPFALEMRLASLDRQGPMRRIRPAAAALCDEIDRIVGLTVQDNQGPAVVHQEEANRPVTVGPRLGDVMPMLNSTTGRAFGAYLPHARACSFIQRELDRIAAQGESADSENPELPQTLGAYDVICTDVYLRGISHIHGDVLPGISAMSLPVFGANGQLCLVLIVLGAQSTFDTTWSNPLERRLRLAAQQLSAGLGYIAPSTPQC